MIATNSQKIINLRKNGYRPDEMILISLVGKIDELNHTVFAVPSIEYDWKWCRELDICVYANSAVIWQPIINSISLENPRFLALWDVDRKEGAEFYRSLNLNCSDANLRHSGTVLDFIDWCSIANRIFLGEICN